MVKPYFTKPSCLYHIFNFLSLFTYLSIHCTQHAARTQNPQIKCHTLPWLSHPCAPFFIYLKSLLIYTFPFHLHGYFLFLQFICRSFFLKSFPHSIFYWLYPHGIIFKNYILGHLVGSVGWATNSWFHLRSWSHGSWDQALHQALCWQWGACLGFSLFPSLSVPPLARSLSLSK